MQDEQVEREHRFVVSSQEAHRFISLASRYLRVQVYDSERPLAYSRTTYFDTPDWHYFTDEEAGIERRIRLRQYASASDRSSPATLSGLAYLEYKESIGSVRDKQRFVAEPGELGGLMLGRRLSQENRKKLAESPLLASLAEAIRECRLCPIFSTWYRRVSLAHEEVRLTIDEDVAFCPPLAIEEAGAQAEPPRILKRVPGRILELKVLGDMPSWLSSALESLAGCETPSKFHLGMHMLASPGSSRLANTRPSRPLAVLAPLRARR